MINDEIVIKTKRLNMRRFNENDLDYLYEITSNPSVMRGAGLLAYFSRSFT